MRQTQRKLQDTSRPGAAARASSRPLERMRLSRPASPKNAQTLYAVIFAYFAAMIDAVMVFGAAVLAGALYNGIALGSRPSFGPAGSVGLVVAALVLLSNAQKGGYDLRHYLTPSGQVPRAFLNWNLAFCAALVVGFATRTSADLPRGVIAAFYLLGFAALLLGRRLAVDALASLRGRGLASPRRVALIGFEAQLTRTLSQKETDDDTVEVVSVFALRDNQAFLADDLALAAAAMRIQRPDDICLALPWSRPEVIEASLDAFLKLPAEIHLGVEDILDRFGQTKVVRLGAVNGLTITHPPLNRIENLEKRLFDIVFSAAAIIALAPLFAIVALLIKRDSSGPAIFRQTRYGFNQEPFRIFKFRTMKTMEDGAKVVQATKSDTRVTRLGAHLRRLSIDELPQLFNVLKGDMSIVGPRPHAMAHDQLYVERLARYARRHTVKPGITGWAQVHGHRGEIEDDSRMQARLEHDLYYIDNWSLWLDIKIVLLTVFSARTHKNAY